MLVRSLGLDRWRRCALWVALLGALVALVAACGGDDDPVGDVGPSGDAGGDGDGDGDGDGSGEENFPCERSDDCAAGLACIETDIFTVGFCAPPCSEDSDCGREVCFSYTGRDQDRHCVEVVREQYELCGPGVGTLCADRSCLFLPDLPLGVCVDICELASSGLDDAGAPADEDAGAPDRSTDCESEQSCIDGVLADTSGMLGVCGTVVDRGDECGIDLGTYCADGDVCAPEDPDDLDSTARCFEDCSQRGAGCPEGTRCTDVRGQFAYCL